MRVARSSTARAALRGNVIDCCMVCVCVCVWCCDVMWDRSKREEGREVGFEGSKKGRKKGFEGSEKEGTTIYRSLRGTESVPSF